MRYLLIPRLTILMVAISCGIAIAGSDRAIETDLMINGLSVGGRFGQAVATADMDGDGYADMIIGAPLSGGPRNMRRLGGEAVIFFGGPAADDTFSYLAPARVFGAAAGNRVGNAVAVGDLDNDGYDDAIIGGDSSVAILFGSPARTGTVDLASPPRNVRMIPAPEGSRQFGRSVASADFDGDGFDDAVIGSDMDGAGSVTIVYGGPYRQMSETTLIAGMDSHDGFGSAMAGGDIDGDGFEDLIIGAYYADGKNNLQRMSGEVVVVYGDPARRQSINLEFDLADLAFLYGADRYDGLGSSVWSGDINGDGFDDLVLGADEGCGPGNMVRRSGEVVVIPGRSTRITEIDLAVPSDQVFTIYGEKPLDRLGSAVMVDDLNGDRFGDIIIGADQADGADENLLLSGEVIVFNGGTVNPVQADLVLEGAGEGHTMGAAVAAGDLNGDGYKDLVMGAPGSDSSRSGRNAGAVMIRFGRPE